MAATNYGCAVAGEHPRWLAPGASGEIPPALNAANMNGPFKKTATVYWNDMKSIPAIQRSAGAESSS